MIKGFLRDDYAQIDRQKYSNKGDQDFYLIAYRDPCLFLDRGLVIYKEPTGNIQLIKDKDYFVSTRDTFYGAPGYVQEDVGSSLRILNPSYYNIDLYISYLWVADYASAEMFNRFDRGLDQMLNSIVTDLSSQVVVDNNGNVVSQGENYPGYREELL